MQYEPLQPDHLYHIYNRGNNSGNLFFEDRNYEYFLLLSKRHLLPIAEIYAYCLLKNHFHLLVRIKDSADSSSASRAFSNFFNAYAKAINKSQGRTGSLFQDRFKRIRIQDEKYLRNIIVYIHLNPEHHLFVEDFREYKYSSFRPIVSGKSSFGQTMNVLDLFGDTENFIQVHLRNRGLGPEFDLGSVEV